MNELFGSGSVDHIQNADSRSNVVLLPVGLRAGYGHSHVLDPYVKLRVPAQETTRNDTREDIRACTRKWGMLSFYAWP